MEYIFFRFSPTISFGKHGNYKKWKWFSGDISKKYVWFELRYKSYFFAANIACGIHTKTEGDGE